MPPQRTNITSEHDAAGLGLDVPIALAKDPLDGALAAARANASISALDGALSDKGAARPPAAATPGVLSLLKRYWRAFLERRQCQSLPAALPYLSDKALMDIGLTRDQIDYLAPQRAIDRLRDSTTYLWSRGGM